MRFPPIPEDDDFIWPKAKGRETVQDKVYRQLAYLLICGFFRPGETISLRQLSSELDVSETPVRNALNRLVAEAAMDVLPNRHVSIPALSRAQFDELMELRTQLETNITMHAYRRVTREDIEKLEKINEELLKAMGEHKLHKCIEQNQKFHLTFYELAKRPLTFASITNLWLRAGTFMSVALRSDGVQWRAEEHINLINALKNKNSDACVDAIARDIDDTYQSIVKLKNGMIFKNGE